MNVFTCQFCGKQFNSTAPRASFCSFECYVRFKDKEMEEKQCFFPVH